MDIVAFAATLVFGTAMLLLALLTFIFTFTKR